MPLVKHERIGIRVLGDTEANYPFLSWYIESVVIFWN